MARPRWVSYGMSAVAGVSLCVACTAMAGGHLLYERIGEQEGIATVVDGFLGKVGADDRVNGRFADTDMPKLRGLLIEQVCEATGGPCTYSGKNMLDAHKGMNITADEFGIVAAHFAAAMSDAGVSADDNGTIMGVLAGMHDDIVGQ